MAITKMNKYSEMILESLKRESVFRGLVNDSYVGTPVKDSTVQILKLGSFAAGDYVAGVGMDATALGTSYEPITIRFSKGINLFIGRGSDAVTPAVLRKLVFQGANELAIAEDDEIIAEIMANGTTSLNTTLLSKDNIYTEILKEKEVMDTDRVNKRDRYLVVAPAVTSYLLTSTEFNKNISDKEVAEGYIGKIAGCLVKESVDLGADVGFVMLSKSQALGFADGLSTPVDIHNVTDSKAVNEQYLKGVMDFGVEVLEPKAVRIREFGA